MVTEGNLVLHFYLEWCSVVLLFEVEEHGWWEEVTYEEAEPWFRIKSILVGLFWDSNRRLHELVSV